jgi:hypothetical protein
MSSEGHTGTPSIGVCGIATDAGSCPEGEVFLFALRGQQGVCCEPQPTTVDPTTGVACADIARLAL